MTRIFDNIDNDLGPHLIDTFANSDSLDAAVGYFNLRGWATFADSIDAKAPRSKPIMRVLIGMTSAAPTNEVLDALQAGLEGRDDIYDVDRESAQARKKSAILEFRTQLMRGLPTETDLRTLRQLRDQIATGTIEVRLFTRRPLHGKTYIAHKKDPNSPVVGFVGSSNLTMAGLKNNFELNVDVLDFDAAGKLASWFEDRWNDRFCIDVSSEIIELIEESWASEQSPTPYEVFLKVCYHLSQDVREGNLEYSLPSELRDQLLEYQASAVQTLARRLVHRDGTMLGDVVGLGKTLTAIATALVLREQYGFSTLVLCPKNLVRMWKEHLDAYDVPGEVVSFSTAHRDLPDLRRYHLVVVDESHNLRSDKRRDYQAIKGYIERNDSKVLLLTATPYNVRFADVANQISLYVDEDQDLGVEPSVALDKDPALRGRLDGRTSTMHAFRKSEEPEDWKNLMSEHLVRRTRSFIRSNFGVADPVDGKEYLAFPNGGRYYFPQRRPVPIDHGFGPNDQAAKISSEWALDKINALKLPRYSIVEYLDPTVTLTRREAEMVKDWERAKGRLIGITRTHFYKRLSSCGFSYDVSLKRHLARNDMWIHALRNGLDVPVGTVIDDMFSDGEPDENASEDNYDALALRNPHQVTWVRGELFGPTMLEHLEEDSQLIRDVIAVYGTWNAADDSKLKALIELLTFTHRHDKVIVFTEYKDTAEYVAKSLVQNGVHEVAVVTGSTDDPTSVVRRFAPEANRKPHEEPAVVPPGQSVRVLVATDVLSEGQNLQDSSVVVNYDIPWAIIKLIQRAGRVDRVGQRADEILLYTFFHESVESVINLRKRIRHRLASNAQAFGSDETFFGSPDEVSELHDLYDGKISEGDSEGEVDASSRAFEVWSKAQKEHPELAHKVQSMPDLVFSTKVATSAEDCGGVATYVRSDRGVDSFGYADPETGLHILSAHQALNVFHADPGTKGERTRSDHFELTAQLVRGPLARARAVEGRLRGVRLRVWNRLSGRVASQDVSNALEAVYSTPLQSAAERRLRSALQTRSSDDDLGGLIVMLHRDGNLVIADDSSSDDVRIVCTMGVVPN